MLHPGCGCGRVDGVVNSIVPLLALIHELIVNCTARSIWAIPTGQGYHVPDYLTDCCGKSLARTNQSGAPLRTVGRMIRNDGIWLANHTYRSTYEYSYAFSFSMVGKNWDRKSIRTILKKPSEAHLPRPVPQRTTWIKIDRHQQHPLHTLLCFCCTAAAQVVQNRESRSRRKNNR